MNGVVIREAVLADVPAVARVNFETWRTAFRGLVPDSYLDNTAPKGLNYEWRVETFTRRLTDSAYGLFVAEVGGTVVGFADGGKTRSPELPFDGELYAIYVLATHQRDGLGRVLTRAVVDRLLSLGCTSMVVWTFERSVFRRFYESLGAVQVSRVVDRRDFHGTMLDIVPFGWSNLTVLATRLAGG